jgi:hypothetical protein
MTPVHQLMMVHASIPLVLDVPTLQLLSTIQRQQLTMDLAAIARRFAQEISMEMD